MQSKVRLVLLAALLFSRSCLSAKTRSPAPQAGPVIQLQINVESILDEHGQTVASRVGELATKCQIGQVHVTGKQRHAFVFMRGGKIVASLERRQLQDKWVVDKFLRKVQTHSGCLDLDLAELLPDL